MSHAPVPPAPSRLPLVLAVTYFVWWAALAVNPVDRAVWWAENIPALLIFGSLVATYRWFRFSNTAYLLMAVWLFLHTFGGHYSFANVPFETITKLFGFQRNHFDRVAHFAMGFYAYPMAELFERKGWSRHWPARLLGLTIIMAIAAGYEIVEWWYAVIAGGDSGVAFLGSQGDVWDAQKDMLGDTLGALASLLIYRRQRPEAHSLRP